MVFISTIERPRLIHCNDYALSAGCGGSTTDGLYYVCSSVHIGSTKRLQLKWAVAAVFYHDERNRRCCAPVKHSSGRALRSSTMSVR